MTLAHLHLLLNHWPIIGTPLVLAVLSWGLFRKYEPVVKTALVLLFPLALLAVGAMLTGDFAAETVEGFAGVETVDITEHDNAAVFALSASLIAAVLAAVTLWRWRKQAQWKWGYVVCAFLAFECTILFRTGYLGGRIRRPELRGEKPPLSGSVHDDVPSKEEGN